MMKDKTCTTCIDNDNGLCDRKGILIHEDDTCNRHKEDSVSYTHLTLPTIRLV